MGRSDEFVVGSSPVPEIAAGAARYRQMMGMHSPEQDYGRSAIPLSQSRAIGRTYMAMPEYDERALPAYHQMAEEVGRQFDHLTRPVSRGGMGINVNVVKADPYGTGDTGQIFSQVRDDVMHHGNIDILDDASTGGHPVFSRDQNNMFRAVHDVFGHLGAGRGVDMHGEDAAFQKHAAMFSPLARQAMATETRGQNAALHLMGDFQDQKVGVLPARFQVPRNLSPTQFGEMATAAQDARFENRKQGI